MAPKSNTKVASAYRAMKSLGITESTVKPVLKKLLITYEKNWELIEQENYRVLADAIFDAEDALASELKKCSNNIEQESVSNKEAPSHADDEMPESERPLKRLRRSGETSLKKPKHEADLTGNLGIEQVTSTIPASNTKHKGKEHVSTRDLPKGDTFSNCIPQSCSNGTTLDIVCSPNIFPDNGIQFSSLVVRDPVPIHSLQLKEPKIEYGIVSVLEKPAIGYELLVPKNEPFTDSNPQFEVPIQVIQPDTNGKTKLAGSDCNGHSHGAVPHLSYYTGGGTNSSLHDSSCLNISTYTGSGHGVEVPESLIHAKTVCPPSYSSKASVTDVEIASSFAGEVKFFLSCNASLVGPEFLMPDVDEVFKMVEAAHKKTDPNFSLKKLMKDVCDCFLELGTDFVNQRQEERAKTISSSIEPSNIFVTSQNSPGSRCNVENTSLESNEATQEPCVIDASEHMILDSRDISRNECEDDGTAEKEFEGACSTYVGDNSQQHHLISDNNKLLHYAEDITKGEERVRIPWLNEVNKESPTPFQYISRSIVFRNASVHLTTDKIRDDNCCLDCYGNCLLSSGSCACAESESSFPYNQLGFLRDELLEKFIPRSLESQQIPVMFCQECPLEKFNVPKSCRGHLARKFIKECWIRCGCSKQCGNRLVQHGITCHLQVFFTPEGKGWGLKTLQDLPKGAFVCEYVGEILTHGEVHERNDSQNNQPNMYVMVQDADWGSRVLEDNKTICIDAKYYGNVARFINHRCFDSNLVQIPVEVEFPDHFYYHLALFTTRNVNALEELTLDYGTNFYAQDHATRNCNCLCGSTFCRKILGTRRDGS